MEATRSEGKLNAVYKLRVEGALIGAVPHGKYSTPIKRVPLMPLLSSAKGAGGSNAGAEC